MAVYLGSNALNVYLGQENVNVKIGSDVYLMTFTIDSNFYQAEEGMTWGEFISSNYNTIGLKVFSQNTFKIANSDETKILSPDLVKYWYVTDVIDPTVSYTLTTIQ